MYYRASTALILVHKSIECIYLDDDIIEKVSYLFSSVGFRLYPNTKNIIIIYNALLRTGEVSRMSELETY